MSLVGLKPGSRALIMQLGVVKWFGQEQSIQRQTYLKQSQIDSFSDMEAMVVLCVNGLRQFDSTCYN